MLDKLLEQYFGDYDTADFGCNADKIKADVLSRIERNERHMKHFSIKSVIIAAAAAAVGLTTVAVSVSASVNNKAVEESSKNEENSVYVDPTAERNFGRETAEELQKLDDRKLDIMNKYYNGIMAEADEKGRIIIEKDLDETDVTGYVPAYYETSQASSPTEEELEWVKKFEEDPQSLGLIPAGKSETFEGGYRIVNRHYINTNEPVDDEKTYYSFRRVYTDDPENRLVASSYFGYRISFAPKYASSFCTERPAKSVLNVFLNHTNDELLYDPGNVFWDEGTDGFSGRSDGNGTYHMGCDWYNLKPNTGTASNSGKVKIRNTVYVTADHVQLLD